MSIAGGLDKALYRGEKTGCEVIQIFSGSNRQWNNRKIDHKEIEAFFKAKRLTDILPIAIHAGYLINLASPKRDVFDKSCRELVREIKKTSLLDIPFLVVHPGSHLGSGEKRGITRVSEALNRIVDRDPMSGTKILLEITAGQGTSLGYRLDHLAAIIDKTENVESFGVCMDTCHAYAAGYDFCSPKAYGHFIKEFETEIGLNRLFLFHVNNSKTPLGSRIDRHDHLSHGHIGLKAFSYFLNDPRFINHPFVIETPKGEKNEVEDPDVTNLRLLRSLIGRTESS
jgi:deoxyribonuclease-4